MLKIYGRANSINVRKVLWACAELDMTYEREDWGRGFRSTAEPEFQALSHFSIIPVIDDDGFILRESNVIVRYLLTKHGREDLFPAQGPRRFEIEAWMDWCSSELYAAIKPVFQGIVFKLPQFDDPKIIADGIEAWVAQTKRIEAHFADGHSYAVRNDFTAADIILGLNVNRWFATPFEKPEFPLIAAYYERLKDRPAFLEHGANGLP